VVKRVAARRPNVLRIKNAVAQTVPVARKPNVIRIKNAVA
jgi:hypothetical protein